MNRLVARYPQVERITAPYTPADPAGELALVEPYLDWQLVEIDIQSSDILLLGPERNGADPHWQRLVVLGGGAVRAWFEHRRGKYSGGKSPAKNYS
jgi:hypothetical protein